VSRALFFFLSLLLTVGLVAAALWAFWPSLTAQAQLPNVPSTAVELPWQFHKPSVGNFLYVELDVKRFTPRIWQIVPDDDLRTLRINGLWVPLDGVRPGGLQDYITGFPIDLSLFLVPGCNHLEFQLDNHEYDGGLTLRPVLGPARWACIVLAFLPLLLGLGRLFRLHPLQTAALGLGLVAIACYWAFTPWWIRTHDVGGGGHLEYASYILSHHALPNPMEGWTYYHPPLYYLLSAGIIAGARGLSLPVPECVQALSLALWLVFLAASAGALRLSLRNRLGALLLATLTVALWPSGVMHAVRIGNDSAFYAAAAVATWFTIRWWQRHRRRDLWGLSAAIAAALLCKSNGTVLLAAGGLLIGGVALRRLRRPSLRWRALGDLVVFAGVTAAGFALSFAVRVYYFLRGDIRDWFISNADGLGSGLRVPVEVKSFLPLDIPTFLTQPWLETGNDATGRGNFWNALLRTSLSGEFTFPGGLHRGLAIGFGVVLLALCLAMLRRAVHAVSRRDVRAAYVNLPWLLLAFLWIAGIAALRVKAPFACSNDFRYVLPAIVPAVLCWVDAGPAARWLMAAIPVLSAAFFFTL
jgi:hypothetical protein